MSATSTEDGRARGLALASALVLIGTFLSQFLFVTQQFGGTRWLLAYVALALLAATATARVLPTRAGLVLGGVLLGLGLVGYFALRPAPSDSILTVQELAADVVEWLTGRSVVLMLDVDLWAVGVAPAPVFLTWFLALRRRYDVAALAGGTALSFFVLTGDAAQSTTLVGMAALLGLVGFGATTTTEAGLRQVQDVGLVIGLAMLVASMVRVVPAAGIREGGGGGRGGDRATRSLEGTLLGDRDRLRVRGSVSLSPEPRFTVEAEHPSYWQSRSFDHYTGGGWRRTNHRAEAIAPLAPPEGDARTNRQTVTAEADVASMPCAWKPVLLGTRTRDLADVTRTGHLDPREPLSPGDEYDVVSAVPTWNETSLREAGDEYPPAVQQRYLRLPDDVPERLAGKADDVAAGAETAYDAAVAVQEWLASNKGYSLRVDQPNWDVVDAFVFSMSNGFCVHFATAMVVLLRLLDVPARFVVGYGVGEHDGGDRWILRGLHSHAWVEVYFPGVGWVPFDPTPASPRREARQERLDESRGTPTGGSANSADGTPTPTSTSTPTGETGNGTNDTEPGNASIGERPEFVREGFQRTPHPAAAADPGEVLVVGASGGADATTATPTAGSGESGGAAGRDGRLWLLGALATIVFGSVRLGIAQSTVRRAWVRWQPRTGSPGRDLDRALRRLEHYLATRFREREPGETYQQYLESLHRRHPRTVDGRALQVLGLYHRNRYGEGASRADADRAIELVDEIVRSG